ncbi:hypothetical protein [Nitrospira tepida]|uniref:hypothetical protein n=1 Tax=Nitrospira tepida TaxID=2973512 RepID=UPI00259D0029|nr:hypothetical protein [Nitrospira tepida]
MDFVEQCRQPLNFVDDDDAILRGELFGQALRTLTEPKVDRRIQEVVDPGPLEALGDQEALSCLARTQEEVRLLLQEALQAQQARDNRRGIHAGRLACVASVVK